MMQDHDPELERMRAALSAAMPFVEAPADARGRILSAVEARIAALPPGAPAGHPVGQAQGAARVGLLAAHPIRAIAVALVAGGAIGAFGHAALQGERIVYVDRVVVPDVGAASTSAPSSRPPSPAPADTTVAVPVESLPVAPSSTVRPAPADSAPPGQQLAAESALLDVARGGIARGEAQQALDAVARHEAQFPHGMLTEEREALAVKALLLADRHDEALARAERFRQRYPQSLFLPALEGSLGGHPQNPDAKLRGR
jgi:hypothetical protein